MHTVGVGNEQNWHLPPRYAVEREFPKRMARSDTQLALAKLYTGEIAYSTDLCKNLTLKAAARRDAAKTLGTHSIGFQLAPVAPAIAA